MSLINKMLSDLEKRDAFLYENQNNILNGLYSAYDLELNKKRQRYMPFFLFVAVFIILLIATTAYYLYFDQAKLGSDNNNTSHNELQAFQIAGVTKSETNHFLKLDDNLLIKVVPPAIKVPVSSYSALNRIDKIYFETNELGINLIMKMPKDIDYLVYGLSNPNRIVIEVNNAELGFLLEDLVPVEPIVAIRYSINKQNRFKLVLESEQLLTIRKSTTGEDNQHYDLVVMMEYQWQEKRLEKRDSDSLVDIVEQQVNEEKSIVFKGELVKTPANKNINAYAEKLFKQAYAEYRNGDISSSLKKLNKVLDQDSAHVNARSTLALILSKQGHTDLSYSILNEGLIQYPNQPEWIKMYARLLLHDEETVQAKELLAKHTPDMSTNVEYYALFAAILQKLDEHNESARIYRNLLQINSSKSVWWMGLGISLESLKRYEDALYAYQKAYKNSLLASASRDFLTQRIDMLSNLIEDEST